MAIFKNLFGQKEEIDKKDYFEYDKIQQETRQKVSFVIKENAYVVGVDRIGIHPEPHEDLGNLRYQICKHKGIPNINDEISDRDAINSWLIRCPVIDFLIR